MYIIYLSYFGHGESKVLGIVNDLTHRRRVPHDLLRNTSHVDTSPTQLLVLNQSHLGAVALARTITSETVIALYSMVTAARRADATPPLPPPAYE